MENLENKTPPKPFDTTVLPALIPEEKVVLRRHETIITPNGERIEVFDDPIRVKAIQLFQAEEPSIFDYTVDQKQAKIRSHEATNKPGSRMYELFGLEVDENEKVTLPVGAIVKRGGGYAVLRRPLVVKIESREARHAYSALLPDRSVVWFPPIPQKTVKSA